VCVRVPADSPLALELACIGTAAWVVERSIISYTQIRLLRPPCPSSTDELSRYALMQTVSLFLKPTGSFRRVWMTSFPPAFLPTQRMLSTSLVERWKKSRSLKAAQG
jgi:hypothetical protein